MGFNLAHSSKAHIHKWDSTWLIVEHILVSWNTLLPNLWCPHLSTSKLDPGLGSLSYSIQREARPWPAPYCRNYPHFPFHFFCFSLLLSQMSSSSPFTVYLHIFPFYPPIYPHPTLNLGTFLTITLADISERKSLQLVKNAKIQWSSLLSLLPVHFSLPHLTTYSLSRPLYD